MIFNITQGREKKEWVVRIYLKDNSCINLYHDKENCIKLLDKIYSKLDDPVKWFYIEHTIIRVEEITLITLVKLKEGSSEQI